MYFTEIGKDFEIDKIVVEDKFGNRLEFDGRLRNNKSLFIKF